jgi:Na+-driven multidrug efflux pump
LKKNTLKYFVNAALFVDISSMAVLGFLLAFVIPRGRARAFSEYFFGLHRHQWTDIHLFLSLFLVPLLFFHILFNWTWVVQSSKRCIGDRWKTFLWALCAAWILALFAGWIVVSV